MKKIFFIIIILFLSFSAESQNDRIIDSLKRVIENLPDDSVKVDKLNELAWKYILKKTDSTILLSTQAIKLSEKIGYLPGLALAYKNMGGGYYYLGNYKKAYDSYITSLELYRKTGDKKGIALILRNLGSVHSQQGIYDKALDYYKKSLNISEDLQDTASIARLYVNIGITFLAQGEWESANDYFLKSLSINEKINNLPGLSENYFTLGSIAMQRVANVKQRLRNNDSTVSPSDTVRFMAEAISYFKKGLEIQNKYLKNKREIARLYEGLGTVYLRLNRLDSVPYYLYKSLDYYKDFGSQLGMANVYNELGDYYLKIRQYARSKRYYEQALKISEEIQAKELRMGVLANIANYYRTIGDYKTAYDYLARHYQLRDSLIREDNIKKAAQTQVQIEFEKQLKQKEMEEKQRQIEQEARLKRQKMVTSFFGFALFLMGVLAVVIFKSYRQKKKANKLLEEKNKQISEKNDMLKKQQQEILAQNELLQRQKEEILKQNSILQQQKEEIEAQRDEIERQRDIVITQRDEIAYKNQQITDSIIYAQRIQQAVLPPDDLIRSMFNEYFILFRPRDIVSGDFYWATKRGKYRFITAADCTGHGVPGAFMSMLGVSLLNEIVNSIDLDSDFKASDILNRLRAEIKRSLRQTGKDNEAKDGMDMAFCIFNFQDEELQFAGAHNPLVLIRNGEIIQYKADRMPIGIHIREKASFTNHEIKMEKGDSYYIFSDGMSDQFGGPAGKKFMAKHMKNIFAENYDKPMEVQKKILNDAIEEWLNYTNEKGEKYEQIDDILIIGIRYI